MYLTRFADAAEFLEAAQAFLVENEVHNCLPLGIAVQLAENPELIRSQPYLAVVEEHGRLVAAAMMTLPERFIVALTDSQAAVGLIASDAHVFSPGLTTVIGAMPVSKWFAEGWRDVTGDLVQDGMHEGLYKLTQVNMPDGVPGRARKATDSDRDLLVAWLGEFHAEVFGGGRGDPVEWVDSILASRARGIYLWEDCEPVSLAGYGGRTPHGIKIGPVYTPPTRRGRGYASACVARVSQDQLDAGREFCCLFTDMANPTSNHIYQVVGYELVCHVQEYKFEPNAET